MEIKKETIEKIWKVWKKRKRSICRGDTGGFELLEGGKIVTTKLKNLTGWYAIVCLYDTPDLHVDIYDMHVFERYQKRFLKDSDKDIVREFFKNGNYEGTMLVKEGEKFEKRIKDGVTLGTIRDGVMYHKTYLTDEMCKENKMEYLLELC